MLNLYFGDLKDALLSGNGYFDNWINPECITSDFGRKVIREIDKGEVFDKNVIVSKVIGGIPPERLSGGTKSLLILMFDNKVMDLASMGDNCLKFLSEIASKKDITVCTDSYRPIFKNSDIDKIYILNSNKFVYNDDEFFEEYKKWW